MGRRHNNQKAGLIAYSKIIFAVSLLILAFFSFNLIREFMNRQGLQKEIGELEQEINNLEQNNQALARTLDYFKTLDFVENEARLKLNMRKPGEKIIIVPEYADDHTGSENVNTIVSVTKAVDNSISNTTKWWNYFFKTNN